jgi:hypothetical protein
MTSARRTPRRRLGSPVRSFLLVIALVGGTLGAVQWSGATRPHVWVDQGQSGPTSDGRHYVAALVRNTGRTPIRIEGVRFGSQGWAEVEGVILPPGTAPSEDGEARQTVGSVTLQPSTEVNDGTWVLVVGRACKGATEDIVLRVRTLSGIERSVVVHDPDWVLISGPRICTA